MPRKPKEYPGFSHRDDTGQVYTLWFHLAHNGDVDLRPELLSDLPAYDEDNDTWLNYCDGDLINIGYDSKEVFPGVYISSGGINFAIAHGLAPYQPFCVRLSYWHSKYWTDCGYEYDAGTEFEMVTVEPVAPHKAARRWEQLLRIRTDNIQDAVARRKKEQELKYADVESMFIYAQKTLANDERTYWSDDMYVPENRAIALSLRTTRAGFEKVKYHPGATPSFPNIHARDEKGRFDKAFQILCEKIRAQMPHVDPLKLKIERAHRW